MKNIFVLLLLCACNSKEQCSWVNGQEFDTCYETLYEGQVLAVFVKGADTIYSPWFPPVPPPTHTTVTMSTEDELEQAQKEFSKINSDIVQIRNRLNQPLPAATCKHLESGIEYINKHAIELQKKIDTLQKGIYRQQEQIKKAPVFR